ncbi:MAG: ABC transporter permease, partial [Natronosporangium sp.]
MTAPALLSSPAAGRSGAVAGRLRHHLLRPAPVLVLLFLLVGIAGQWLAPHDPNEIDLAARLQGPSAEHLFGTDQFGRDMLSRVLGGARLSLTIAVAGTALALALGVLVGATAAYVGRWVDAVLMRAMDVLLAFPYIVLALALAWVIGPSQASVTLVIAVIRFPQFARITRASVLQVRGRNYVAAAELVGQRDTTIMLRHVLPNALSTTVVYATLAMGTAITTEAALSFLGVGLPPPAPSWGAALAEAQPFLGSAPWLVIFP